MEKTKTLTSRASLGEILVRLGVITVDQLAEALPHCDTHQRNLLSVLAEMGVAPEDRLLKAISVQQHVPYFTTFEGMLEPDAAKLLPSKLARKLLVVPVRKTKKGLMLAMVNPLDIVAIDTVAGHTGSKVLPVLTTRKNLFDTINTVFQDEPAAPEPAPAPDAEKGEKDGKDAKKDPSAAAAAAIAKAKTQRVKIVARTADSFLARRGAQDASVIEIVDAIIAQAVSMRASDVHLEPTANNLRVRMRIDGMLRELMAFSKEQEPAIVARIKILSHLDITEVRLPQDGHISVDFETRSIDLRVSTLPTIFGEKTVIRVLDQASSQQTLATMGLPQQVMETFSKVIKAPMGLLLVTGPTGSGKTTTLYAALNELNTPERNIVTLEDPVEYRLAGINQVETNHRIGFTFATALRSVLRQDPNVVLVGEIRDLETAEIAIQASITGHLVFSTLHTKDTVGTIARLMNMKCEPYLLSAALSGVLAQRLVRKLCDKCKVEHMPTRQEVSILGVPLAQTGPFFTSSPNGCDECMGLGYKGRRGVHEWLVIGKEMRQLITAGMPPDALREAAKAAGMRTLQESALEWVYKGVTSLAEVVRVTHEEDFAEKKEDKK